MGDLTWEYEQKLVCPNNLVGKIDLFQTSHHGLPRSNSPQFVWALQPKVMVMNNGPHKGGTPSVFDILRHSPGLEDLWQLHLALGTPRDQNSADDLIANFENSRDCKGAGIVASVDSSGRYTITNMRNGFKKTYDSR
ncbi:MAG TPA: MBL fold metallo-hydrolase, partial [Bryobacteraceae bacterium]|nr:MBL fold metallo-hydrolase [Bryobacteraceae bacterium]